ncbi:unnamed protein product [Penicillium manginii]
MDDDYVAQLMAKEAAESSKKYSLEGLGAYNSQKRSVNAPKANTRFLRHLIKETDNHNTALKRKEERDARERMRQMKDQGTRESSSQRLSPAPRVHERERHSSTRASDRSHRDDRRHDSRRDDKRSDQSRSHRRSHRHRSRSPSSDRDRRHRRRHDRSRSRDTHRDRERKSRRRDDDRDRSRGRDREAEERHSHRSTTYQKRKHSKSRSRSPRRDRSAERHRSRRHYKSPSGARSSTSDRKEGRRPRSDNNTRSSHESKYAASPDPVEKIINKPEPSIQRRDREESDPLEDMFGPLPPHTNGESAAPVRSRGRGAYKASSSNIDSHFAADYDPTVDIQPDDDQPSSNQPTRRPVAGLMTGEDDWDAALEALRDRAKWKQKGEERLREAGLNETIIERWKENTASTGTGGEKRPEDVRWSKKGEGREWDRGKVVDDQGHTDVHALW